MNKVDLVVHTADKYAALQVRIDRSLMKKVMSKKVDAQSGKQHDPHFAL